MPREPEDSHATDERVETHLWEYVHVVLRRRNLVLVVFLAIVAATTVKTLLTEPVYEGVTSVLIERADPNVLTFKEVQQAEAGRDDYYQTQYKLLQSRSLARRTIETMNLLNEPEFGGPLSAQDLAAAKAAAPGASPIMEKAVDRFLKKLYVRPVRNSRMVNVAFQSHRPDLAASVANRVSTLYIQQALDFRFQTSSEAGNWLGGQVEESRKRVEDLDRQLRELKQREGLVNIEERRTLLEQRLKELGTALNERKTERLQKEALWRQMSGARNPEELPEVMRSGLVQSLRGELASLERQQAQLLERYMDEHPEVVRVRKQITETRNKIRSESRAVIAAAENDYRAAAGQEASISSALEAAKAEVLDLSRRTVSYDTQKRELDAANQVLNSLLSRSKETDVASELKASNIRVVDPASLPAEPVKPRKVRDISLGALIGLVMSIGLAFFLEYLDNTLKTPDDVKNHLGTPLLGVIPEVTSEPETIVGRKPDDDSAFLEGYRGVRTSLNYSWGDAAPRVVVVTSTSPGEGKTVTSVNLACILAATEGKVLLIDADLRKPRAHTYFKGPRTPGLSDILVGRAKPSEAVQKLPNGLHFLPSGTTAPSPADLLTNRSLRTFIEGLRQHYDWVVIDTPPVGAVAEPLILAPLGDGVVLVAGAEMVPRRAVKHTLERISDTGARVLGLILNRAQIEKHAYYYGHYYGHYYGRYGKQPDRGRVATAAQSVRDKVAPFTGRGRG